LTFFAPELKRCEKDGVLGDGAVEKTESRPADSWSRDATADAMDAVATALKRCG